MLIIEIFNPGLYGESRKKKNIKVEKLRSFPLFLFFFLCWLKTEKKWAQFSVKQKKKGKQRNYKEHKTALKCVYIHIRIYTHTHIHIYKVY